MVKFELKKFAKQLEKSIVQISKDTGLHRNTISALYHGKANGISFETLERICKTYSLPISEIIVIEGISESQYSERLYRQEGELVPFTSWGFMQSFNDFPLKYFRTSGIGPIHAYFRKNQGSVYLSTEAMDALAAWVWNTYSKPEDLLRLWNVYLLAADRIEQMYLRYDTADIMAFSEDELLQFVSVIREMQKNFWGSSLFLDTFDAGFDRKQIERIARINKLSLEDIAILTTPEELTFTQERLRALLEYTFVFTERHSLENNSLGKIIPLLQKDQNFTDFIKRFGYTHSSYAGVRTLKIKEIAKEMLPYISSQALAKRDIDSLNNHAKAMRDRISKKLKQKALTANPLFFFQHLTYWREHRKKINLMGISLLYAILERLSNASGIDGEFLKYLSMDEIEGVLRGLVTRNVLEERYVNGVLIVTDGKHYKIIEGEEAGAIHKDLEASVAVSPTLKKLSGQTVYGGYAKGPARLVFTLSDAMKIQAGEIAVSPMTRPELIPFLKKAAAIITDEGGITCHAAIIAREFHVPCIVGLHNATRMIKDGGLVEVRGHHGTVRIFS